MEIRYDERGLVPAIVQHAYTGEVLMQAYMNQEALKLTLETGKATFFSRSRQQLWVKGETSGNTQQVTSVAADCDGDCILVKVLPAGPACHTGERTCFHNEIARMAPDGHILDRLKAVIEDRRIHPKEGSYTNYLFDKGVDKICKKVGEESAEVIIAAKNRVHDEVQYEAADLIYHLLVLLTEQEVPLEDIWAELEKRR